MEDVDGEILREFLAESQELLDQLDKDFVELERDPDNRERLASIFRAIHTIKGTCGFLSFTRLEALTHAGEGVLSRLRDGEIRLSAGMTSALLAMIDAVRSTLACIEWQGSDEARDHRALIETLRRFEAQAPEPDDEPIDAGPGAAPGPSARAATVRVDVGLLDNLMNLVGELVLTRNQLLQHSHGAADAAFAMSTQRLNAITSELQTGVMKTRMQPIESLWRKLPRVVRDLARACDRRINLEMRGRETELDRTLIEALRDPLMHLVRNAVDHGLEPDAERIAAGKPIEGRLRLRAYHESGQVIVELSDDGRGIDVERLRAKAISSGLLAPDHAQRLTPREALQLVFMPGLSTAETVTQVSGRGVGLDVVTTNIERIGGTVDVFSEPGLGTTFKLKIPLTLAIIPALMVRAGAERFALPQASLLELIRLDADARIERIGGAPVHRRRGRLVPLVDLTGLLELGAPPRAERFVAFVQADGRQFGLVLDGIGDTHEIVVKPLSPQVKWLSVFAGATVMGDGQIALILDVMGIAQVTGVLSGVDVPPPVEEAAPDPGPTATLLVCRLGDGRVALPLDAVARLEEIPARRVERAGRRELVQERGGVLPLVWLADVLGEPRAALTEHLSVVVLASGTPGLVVDAVLDIVDHVPLRLTPAGRPGALGVQAVGGRVTELLDVDAVERAAAAPVPPTMAGV